jgi:hypothetical protein
MRIRAETIALLSLMMGFAAMAEEAPDCAGLAAGIAGIKGYEASIPPAGPDQGWCVLDGVTLRSQRTGWPNLSAERLRVRLSATTIDVDMTGLRIAPRLGDREVDERWRSLMRLQTLDLTLRAAHDPATGVLTLGEALVELSGGSTLRLEGEINGADLSPGSLAGAAVTRMRLDWRNDGRILRPVMEILGEALGGASGGEAVEAARAALAGVVAALPGTALDDESRAALEAAVAALPQGRGKLVLAIDAPEGIGAARVAVAVLSGDPLSGTALDALLDGAVIAAEWQPGLEQ